ncbi:hypothetical protein J5N97_005692 [Dioscorea zingiberensis]|uniref:Uncharacterized protein n=1 Tax=Dioscorea zingiberensis TaxID=325984 RepID=A0A9D5D8I2_9LILI|nr:hypothetical protein J5N97_005692 [Dioscorea zingiberensis]
MGLLLAIGMCIGPPQFKKGAIHAGHLLVSLIDGLALNHLISLRFLPRNIDDSHGRPSTAVRRPKMIMTDDLFWYQSIKESSPPPPPPPIAMAKHPTRVTVQKKVTPLSTLSEMVGDMLFKLVFSQPLK